MCNSSIEAVEAVNADCSLIVHSTLFVPRLIIKLLRKYFRMLAFSYLAHAQFISTNILLHICTNADLSIHKVFSKHFKQMPELLHRQLQVGQPNVLLDTLKQGFGQQVIQ